MPIYFNEDERKARQAQNTTNFINVLMDSMMRKREIEAQQALRDAQTAQINQNVDILRQYLPVTDPQTGMTSYIPRPQTQQVQPQQPQLPTAVPPGTNLTPQVLAMYNARQPQSLPQSSLQPTFVGAAGGRPKFGYNPLDVLQQKTQQERAIGASNEATGTKRFLQQFERSYNELKEMSPDFDKIGYEGKLKRTGLSIAKSLDYLPETSAFLTELKPLANQMARDVEGGRVTDQDRKIYADAFANTIKNPSLENVRLSSNSLIKMADKGGDISKVLYTLSQSKTKVMQDILTEVSKQYRLQINKTTGEVRMVPNE